MMSSDMWRSAISFHSSLSAATAAFNGGKMLRMRMLHLPCTFDNWSSRLDLIPCTKAIAEELDVEEATSTATVIDGKAIASNIRREIADEVEKMKANLGKVPGLAVVLVGNRKDSQSYVTSKEKACQQAGIASYGIHLPEDTSAQDILRHIHSFNANPNIHGILVQLPLPKGIEEEKILSEVSMEKDVDGFHPINIGKLAMQGRQPLFVPCTPKACLHLLLTAGVELSGKHAVVIGRSNIVGMPTALLLQRHNATVTIVHSYTPNPAEVTRRADIVIAAAGIAHLVRGDWLKPGAVVIDVGINAVEDKSRKSGYRMVGDVSYNEASRIASAITPVPGGVGPMTIAMLLQNTLDSAKRAYAISQT